MIWISLQSSGLFVKGSDVASDQCVAGLDKTKARGSCCLDMIFGAVNVMLDLKHF